jgi:hypothetical protein
MYILGPRAGYFGVRVRSRLPPANLRNLVGGQALRIPRAYRFLYTPQRIV